jgi:hypothetical protein
VKDPYEQALAFRGDGIVPVVYADWNGQRYEVVGK